MDFGTRRHVHVGFVFTMSTTAPTMTMPATMPKPHQPSRLRQNWPASSVNSAKVEYAPIHASRRPEVIAVKATARPIACIRRTQPGP